MRAYIKAQLLEKAESVVLKYFTVRTVVLNLRDNIYSRLCPKTICSLNLPDNKLTFYSWRLLLFRICIHIITSINVDCEKAKVTLYHGNGSESIYVKNNTSMFDLMHNDQILTDVEDPYMEYDLLLSNGDSVDMLSYISKYESDTLLVDVLLFENIIPEWSQCVCVNVKKLVDGVVLVVNYTYEQVVDKTLHEL